MLGGGLAGLPERVDGLVGVSGPVVGAGGLDVEVGAALGGDGYDRRKVLPGDICPQAQRALCHGAHQPPTAGQFRRVLTQLGYDTPTLADGGHLWTHGLTEQQRYPIQHQPRFQVWDLDLPHFAHAHGRSLLGYQPGEQERADVAAARERLTARARFDDD